MERKRWVNGSGTYCAVGSCNNCRKKAQKTGTLISFHRFPKNPKLRKIWVRACRRADRVNFENAFVCSDHFEDSDFVRDFKAELMNLKLKRRLKEGAVPSVNLPEPRQIVPVKTGFDSSDHTDDNEEADDERESDAGKCGSSGHSLKTTSETD